MQDVFEANCLALELMTDIDLIAAKSVFGLHQLLTIKRNFRKGVETIKL